MTILSKTTLNKWYNSLKEHLSFYSREKLDELVQNTSLQKDLGECKKDIVVALSAHITQRIEILEVSKKIFSDEVENLDKPEDFSSRIELFSSMHSDLEEIYRFMSYRLTSQNYAENEVKIVIELVKRLTAFSVVEIEDEFSDDPKTLKFNFLHHLKFFLFSQDEGLNTLINELKKDLKIVHDFSK